MRNKGKMRKKGREKREKKRQRSFIKARHDTTFEHGRHDTTVYAIVCIFSGGTPSQQRENLLPRITYKKQHNNKSTLFDDYSMIIKACMHVCISQPPRERYTQGLIQQNEICCQPNCPHHKAPKPLECPRNILSKVTAAQHASLVLSAWVCSVYSSVTTSGAVCRYSCWKVVITMFCRLSSCCPSPHSHVNSCKPTNDMRNPPPPLMTTAAEKRCVLIFCRYAWWVVAGG